MGNILQLSENGIFCVGNILQISENGIFCVGNILQISENETRDIGECGTLHMALSMEYRISKWMDIKIDNLL